VVVLAAPAGHGKTCLAAQLAAATGGPLAWFTADELDRDRAGVVTQLFRALGRVWTDLGDTMPAVLDDDAAVPLLGAALETLAGPGCIVLDDVHLLPGHVLDAIARTAIDALPADCRLVVCTRGDPPASVLRAEAAGRAVTLGPTELAFDVEECRQVCAAAGIDEVLVTWTGGWPLAVGLSIQAGLTGPAEARDADGVARRRVSALADLALADLTPPCRAMLAVLTRLPCFPSRLAAPLGPRCRAIEAFGRRHPTLMPYADGWWTPREWLRDALAVFGRDPSLVATVATALVDVGEEELAAQLLMAEARYDEAVPLVERLAADGLGSGRPSWVRALIAGIPPSHRTFTLDLQAATAAERLTIMDPSSKDAVSEGALLDLVDRAGAVGPGARLQAQALLATYYRMQADLRLFEVCEAAIPDALAGEWPARVIADRWSSDDVPAAAEMLRLYGYGLLFAQDASTIERGQRLVGAAMQLLDGAGRPTLSYRAWLAYFEALLFLRPAAEAEPLVRRAAHRMAELNHSDAPMRLAELATLEYAVDDPAAARRTIELARDLSDRTGNCIALAPLASIEIGLDVWAAAELTPEHRSRFDEVAAELAGHPRLAPYAALIVAEFGITLVRNGHPAAARHYLEAAESSLGGSLFGHPTSFRRRRLLGLILLAEGATAEGHDVLLGVRHDAAGEGRLGLVELIDADLAERTPGDRGASPPVVVHVLGPELSVSVDGRPVPSPRGYPAKLLALLVAANGTLTVDAAIEGLWPEADLDIGRNRLHGVLLRLRRGLGLPAGGPVNCTGGVVRLERSPLLEVDSWEFERAATRAESDPVWRMEAASRYRGDVLASQFAYDDPISEYRRTVRRRFLRLAAAVLDDPPRSAGADDVADLARRAWAIAPDDEALCRQAAATLTRLGCRAEAGEMVDATRRALDELGFDGERFRRTALRSLVPVPSLQLAN
jgi:DNA-binding SARP family transcriptional activator